MFPVLHLGSLAIQTPGLILILGLWLGLTLAERYSPRSGIQPAMLYNIAAIGLVTAAIGGRLAYAAENIDAFTKSPISLIALNFSLWDAPGGVILGFTAMIWYAMRHKMELWRVADSFTPAINVMMIALGFAQLASGDAYGVPARLPWSIYIWGEWRHPSQIYAILGAVVILIWLYTRINTHREEGLLYPAGGLFLAFSACSAVVTLFLSRFQAENGLLPGQIHPSQVAAWIVLAISLLLLGKRKRSAPQASGFFTE